MIITVPNWLAVVLAVSIIPVALRDIVKLLITLLELLERRHVRRNPPNRVP